MKKSKIRWRYSFQSSQLAVFVIIFAAVGGYLLWRGLAATTNIVYVSTGGNDSTCVVGDTSKPCASFGAAYQKLTNCGGTVQVAAGTYPGQTILKNPALAACGTDTTIKPATGAKVITATVNIGTTTASTQPSHVFYTGFDYDGGGSWNGPGTWPSTATPLNIRGSYITVDNSHYAYFDALSGDHNTIQNSENGPCWVPSQQDIDNNNGPGCTMRMIGTEIHLKNVKVHGTGCLNSNVSPDGISWCNPPSNLGKKNWHTDGAFLRGCNSCSVENSSFYDNAVAHIRMQNCCSLPNLQDITFENNWFGPLNSTGAGVDIDNLIPGLKLIHNSFGPGNGIKASDPSRDGGVGNRLGTADSPAKVVGNILSIATYTACPGYSDWYYNLLTGNKTCGVGDKLVSSYGYKANSVAGPLDYHLLTGSPAIGLVSASAPEGCSFPDYDGQSRSNPCDAGASEYGSTGGGTPAATVTLTASPTAITSGDSSTLSWSSTNATGCTASGGWSGSKATSGSQTVAPTATATYSLSCSGAGGSGADSATVTVSGAAADTTPPTPPQGGLRVTGKNATTVSIAWNAASDNVGVAGYKLYNGSTVAATTPKLTYTFTGLTCDTTYSSLGVQTYDAAGNTSKLAQAIVLPVTTDACASSTPGDINKDGQVDLADLAILLSKWNTADPDADINSSGRVDIFDLSTLLNNFGK